MSAAVLAASSINLQTVLIVLAIIALILLICWFIFGRSRGVR